MNLYYLAEVFGTMHLLHRPNLTGGENIRQPGAAEYDAEIALNAAAPAN